MRFARLKDVFNWKYIIGEILLIFLGISLAIWFNNWNASIKSRQVKHMASIKVKEEIRNNFKELELALAENSKTIKAYLAYHSYFLPESTDVLATPAAFHEIHRVHPSFYTLVDSVADNNGKYVYHGRIAIELELPSLSAIAWETVKTLGISNDFDYECLYNLESLYNLQERVLEELDKASNSLQNRRIEELISVLQFADQMGTQLMSQYASAAEMIDNCR